MQYMTSLAPPALTATAISIMATIIWVLGKGVSTTITHFCHNFSSEKQCVGRMSSSCPGWLHAVRGAVQPVWNEGDVPCRRSWPHCYRPCLPHPLPCCSQKVTCMLWSGWKILFQGRKGERNKWGKAGRRRKRTSAWILLVDQIVTGRQLKRNKRDKSELVTLLNRIVKPKYLSNCFDNILGWSFMAIPAKM